MRVTQHPMPGEIVRVDLCEECARKRGLSDTDGFALTKLLLAVEIKKGRG